MSMQQDTWWTKHDNHGRGQVDIVHRHCRFLIDSMEHLLLTNNYYIKRKNRNDHAMSIVSILSEHR